MARNIFKSTLQNASAPQCAWLYEVQFVGVDNNIITYEAENYRTLTDNINSITMPSFTTKYITQNFLNTHKTFAVSRDYSGEGTMTLQVRDRNFFNQLGFQNPAGSHNDQAFSHGEFETMPFNEIRAITYNRALGTDVMFPNLYITYNNVLLLDCNFNDLSYTSEDVLSCTIKFHYDYWTIDDANHVSMSS